MSSVEGLLDSLVNVTGVRVARKVPLSSVTSFGVGGPADALIVADTQNGLQNVLVTLGREGARWFVLGAGTNVIFEDSGFRGVVLKLGSGFADISGEETGVLAGASASWSDLLSYCAESGLAGLEKTAGIPGTIGGAVSGNAGAFGATAGDRVEWVRGVNASGEEGRIRAGDIGFSYRHAGFPEGFVLTQVALSMEAGDRQALLSAMDEIVSRRKEKQPLDQPSAGSIFKNPEGGKAGRLIEEAGLKGRSVGAAQVSPKHANFIVNTGGATAKDVLTLIDVVREEVLKRFSIELALEVKVVR